MDCIVFANQVLNQKEVINNIPGDKSISHRAVIFGSLSEQKILFDNFLFSEDCLNTAKIFQQMGVSINCNYENKQLSVQGVGLSGLKTPQDVLDVGNSGTSIRLLSGLLAAQTFNSVITGDASIQRRPMGRVVNPLLKMGARISGNEIEGKTGIYPPLKIKGQNDRLRGIEYVMPVASAQVKSALMLAGLYADSPSVIEEPEICRDHTERILGFLGVNIEKKGKNIKIYPPEKLEARQTILSIPGDISSAAFYMVLGVCSSEIEQWTLKNIGINSTRNYIIDLLKLMGAEITVSDISQQDYEPMGNISLAASQLSLVDINKDKIPNIIDEIPILAIAGLFSKNGFKINNATELRVKESDRIKSVVNLITAMGGNIVEFEDGFEITPENNFRDFEVDSFGDHRIAMSAIVGALLTKRKAVIHNIDCINTSFPNFFEILKSIGVKYEIR